MSTPYPRHVPTEADQKEAMRLANKINNLPHNRKLLSIAALILENHSLTSECKAHREALDLEPLPAFQPPK